jgi:hypothetical protein
MSGETRSTIDPQDFETPEFLNPNSIFKTVCFQRVTKKCVAKLPDCHLCGVAKQTENDLGGQIGLSPGVTHSDYHSSRRAVFNDPNGGEIILTHQGEPNFSGQPGTVTLRRRSSSNKP